MAVTAKKYGCLRETCGGGGACSISSVNVYLDAKKYVGDDGGGGYSGDELQRGAYKYSPE